MTAFLLIQQEHRKAVKLYDGDRRTIEKAKTPELVARCLVCDYGAPWSMPHASPEIRHAKQKRLDAAGVRLSELFKSDPTAKMAERCWAAARGHLPSEAQKFYRDWKDLLSGVDRSKAGPSP